MSVLRPKKSVTPETIDCRGKATVTLGFDAAAELLSDPADIVLIMDRSYSMDPERMFFAKAAANDLIRTVADASAPAGSTVIGGGSRIGIVSFAAQATQAVQLTDNLAPLITAIEGLARGGNTNHRAAFEAAEAVLGPKGINRQIAVMFTDGLTTTGGDARPVTDRMKAAGVEIYCIGLLDDPAPLNQWASDPLEAHVSFTSEQKELEALFHNIAARIVIPGAEQIVLRETVSDDFKITSVGVPSHGTAVITGPRSLVWTMDYAGVTLDPEPVRLTFEILHVATSGGIKAFNQTVSYTDLAGNALAFPSPVVEVLCGNTPIYPEPCPEPTEFTVPGCQDAVRISLDAARMLSLGRIVQLDVTLKSVCPGKSVAVSVILSEAGLDGAAYPRGVKHILVPPQTGEGCRDVRLNCIPFSVPEALKPEGDPAALCTARHFRAQVIANYVDTDFTCCEAQATVL